MVVAKARKTVDDKYADEIQRIENAYKMKEIKTKALYTMQLKAIEARKQEEIKSLIKEWFDYQIPIAKVEKAGITTTGAACENELNNVLEEYRVYFAQNPLWEVATNRYVYSLDNNLILSKVYSK